MRDSSLLIVIIGATLVSVCSSNPQSFRGSTEDEPLRMASESLVVKSYKDAETSTTATTKSHGSRFEEYQVYQGVMGRPGIDFPVYPQIPATSFSCRGVKKSGYYADLETDCQVFHICDGNRKISFLCPNGTIFRQSHLICDWWFRVDCGKSVELYEESAEQLAADQKIYKARSEEREKRRKLGKAAIETGGELTSSEVYALDEPFLIKSRKTEQNRSGTRAPPVRNSFDSRKSERHSKKVVDSGATEKFPSYKPKGRNSDNRNQNQEGVSFVDGGVTQSYKARGQTQNSISLANKENIQPAESGSLVEDLNNRNVNFAYNSTTQSFDYNTRNNYNRNQTKKAETSDNRFTYNDENRNINFNYDRRTQETTRTQKPTEATFTTEYFNYESRRTNPTVPPTFATTRNSQSSRYRSSTLGYQTSTPGYQTSTLGYQSSTQAYQSSTPGYQSSTQGYQSSTPGYQSSAQGYQSSTPGYQSSTAGYQEQERQYLAETASFGSNRGGKSYADFQNQFSTTEKPFRTTFYTTSKRVEAFPTTTLPPPVQTNYNQEYRTTTYRPVKQHSRKVTLYPSTNPQTTFANRVWQTTTYQPYVETTTDKFTVDDIYFTTSTPLKEVETVTDWSQTSKPDVDISLQELNINRTPPPNTTNISYDDEREGVEVPPSSGPSAIRTFALYFATTNKEEPKTTAYLPETTTILTPFEIKKKEVVKQVDELVQRSSVNVSDVPHSEELPNSLTFHTQHSYSELFPPQPENRTDETTENFETTAFESFTEEPNKINKELTKNDLDGSQSRGLVEPDTDYKVSPDLRELAQVFTKALSAYLDDPEAFRRVLSEIRPTEPTTDAEVSSTNPLEYPSATQEDDEVLDFSDVTKSTYRKKTSTVSQFQETTTEYQTEATTNANDIDNFVVPVNQSSWATNIELTAPLLETLDQSQSNYYTPPPYIGTTNAIAEEINNEFTASDQQEVDSYLPIKGSVDDPSLPRYGGFQNNTNPTTKYSPYGAELTSTTYLPYGADLTSTPNPNSTVDITTFNPNNVTSFFSHFSKNETEEGEIQLAKELNNLVLLQKFTTPRGAQKEITTAEPNLSTAHLSTQNDISQDVEVQEKSGRAGKALFFPESTISSNYFEPDAKEINLELSPPPSTPKGFLITYSIGGSSEPATYLPKATTPVLQATTYAPGRQTTYTFIPETQPPTEIPQFENFSQRLERLTNSRTTTTTTTTTPFPTTFARSIERLAQLQETLMFNTNNLTLQQRDQARVSVEEMIDKMNMTDSTANTLMKVMEMAAKNETYRRLVLLLVNDKSGRNKTVEESRLSLLKALLTPVINPPRTVVPIPETSRLVLEEGRRRSGSRRSKSIKSDNAINVVGTTIPMTTTQKRPSNGRKPNRGLTRAESNYQSGLGNLGVIRRTIENSRNKQVKINTIDDAILDSDSRAVELLRSLYSLAARWG